MMVKPKKTADLSLWEIMDSRQTAMEQEWDWPRLFVAGWELGSLVFCGTLSSGTRIFPWCMSWVFETYSLCWDALFRFDAEGRDLVLNQVDMPCFVDYHKRLYPIWMVTKKELMWGRKGRWAKGTGGKGEGKLWLIPKIN